MLLSKIINLNQDFQVDNLKASGGRGIHSHAHARSSSESESSNKKTKRSIKATEDRQTRKRQCRTEAYTKANTKPAIDRQEPFSSGVENSSSDSSDSDSNSETGLESPSESKNQKRPSNNNAELFTTAGGNHFDHRSYYNKIFTHYNAEQSPRDSDSDPNSCAIGKNNNRSYKTVAGNTKITYNFG